MRLIPFVALAATLACVACGSASNDANAQYNNNTQEFSRWLADFRQEAAEQGISRQVLDEALSGIEPDDRVLELDQQQPETTLSMDEYLHQLLTSKLINEAREHYQENHTLLKEVGQRYGVQPQYIVALWGIESRFGTRQGHFNTIESLATLAYDGRRSDFFRDELLKALLIIQRGHITAHEMEGSWAGAMGQSQFMPSSFLKYAVDYNGDGKKDIWHTHADVFASIANYLHQEGWNHREGWGTEAHPGGNFNVLLKWNRSRYFATAVGMLADDIAQERPRGKKHTKHHRKTRKKRGKK